MALGVYRNSPSNAYTGAGMKIKWIIFFLVFPWFAESARVLIPGSQHTSRILLSCARRSRWNFGEE
jgi:hypothetical protein